MDKRKAIALGKFLLVQLVESEKSGIIIPETVNQATAGSHYTVRSTGPLCQCGAKVGDQIIISAPAAQELIHEGETYWAILDTAVAVVLR